jgi:hypothetical protein
MAAFEPPAPDLAQLLADWEMWEQGGETPGRILANLKTHGMGGLLAQLAESGWTPKP